jgi:hypothetical protein
MARKESLPSVTSEEDEQIDYHIFLILLGEEGRNNSFIIFRCVVSVKKLRI